MVTKCGWCDVLLSETPEEPKMTSHGICGPCSVRVHAEIDREIADSTVALLVRGGFSRRLIDQSTVQYWVRQGLSPQRIAMEIYQVKGAR